MAAPTKQAVFLIRHADDIDGGSENWEWCTDDPNGPDDPALRADARKEGDIDKKNKRENWFKELLPDGNETSFPWRRLTPTGKNQAKNISNYIINQTRAGGPLYPVGRVITKNPYGFDNSQNPFDTVLPLINKIKEGERDRRSGRDLELMLLEDTDDLMANFMFLGLNNLLRLDGSSGLFSTVICWDREGMWGFKKDEKGNVLYEKNKPVKIPSNAPPAKDSLLGILGKHFFDNYYEGDNWKNQLTYPEKGKSLYKLWDLNNDWRMDFEQYNMETGKRLSLYATDPAQP